MGHRIVLLGAGHAHLEVVRRADELHAVGAVVTLVSPGDLWYSGLASAVVGGRLPAERDRVDVAALCAATDVRLVRGRAVGLDLDARAVRVRSASPDSAGGAAGLEALGYDSLSLNVGSELALGGLDVDHDADDVLRIKPIQHHRELHDRVVDGMRERDVRVTVVGGGASAVEYAANLALLRRDGAAPPTSRHRPVVTVVSGDVDVVPPASPSARERMHELLHVRGVRVVRGIFADRVRQGACDLADGTTIEHDVCVLATGLQAARAVRDLGLGDERGMPTDRRLVHPDHPEVLGAGDAIRFDGDGLPRLGVFGVRQAQVLVDNLVARATGGELRTYEPQERFLAIMDMGGGTAVAMRGGRWYEGRLALVLKRFLDERWMRRYRVGRQPAQGSRR